MLTNQSKNTLKFLLKSVIIAGIIFLAIFIYSSQITKIKDAQKIKAIQAEVENDDLIISGNAQEVLEEAIDEIYTPGHSAATDYKKKFQLLCVENILTCIRVDFDEDLDYKEQYFYFASIVYVSKFLDKSMESGEKFNETIKSIDLQKGEGDRRGYATSRHIEINLDLIESYPEFIEIFTHEAGHIVDLGSIQGSDRKKDYNYTEFGKAVFSVDDPSIEYYSISFDSEDTRKKYATKNDFCSRYGMTDPFEDFSECFNLFINHNSLFYQMAKENDALKEKYAYIHKLLQGSYLQKDTENISKILKNPTRRVWDTTRI